MKAAQDEVESIYAMGPIRDKCILCGTALTSDCSFRRGPVTYGRCSHCGQFNGSHEVTHQFETYAYTDGEEGFVETNAGSEVTKPFGKEFSTGPMFNEYDNVVKRIYEPKAAFLRDVLIEDGKDPNDIEVLDIGCGGGHFIQALHRVGFQKLEGVDSLASAIEQARTVDPTPNRFRVLSTVDLEDLVSTCPQRVVSMMCLLPHLSDPVRILRLLKGNQNVQYLYQKLPMWSFAVMLESALPGTHARVLAETHTHIFSRESLRWLEGELEFERVGEWIFGADSLDLQRKLLTLLEIGSATPAYISLVRDELNPMLGPLQEQIDLGLLSSEIHLVWDMRP